MEAVIDIFLPLSLAFIMFTLGLVLADFGRVFQQPVGFLIGALGQLVVLPLVALLIIWMFGLADLDAPGYAAGALAVGGLVAGQAAGDETFSAFAIASGVYGITMYVVSLPFVLWRRRNS